MNVYFKARNTEINADMEWYSSEVLSTAEMREMEKLSAEDLIHYAEAVPSWDYLDDGMWDYIAYWYDLPEQGEDFDPEAFLAAAKAAAGIADPESKTWYAVMVDADDTDWGTGSFDLGEAKAMAAEYRANGHEDAYIAVIDDGDDPICIDEIHEF